MLQTMSKVLAKVKDYAITEEMLNETVDALRTQQHINITSEEQKQDLLDELIVKNNVKAIQMTPSRLNLV